MTSPRTAALARSGAVLAVGTTAANVLGYVLVLLLARALSPEALGAAGALLNLAVIGMVPGLGLQLVVARAVAAPGAAGPPTTADAVTAGLGVGCVLALGLAAASPLLDPFLRLGSGWPAVLTGAWLVPSTAALAVQGVLQGRERFGALALALVVTAAARPVAGVVAVATGAGPAGLFGLLTAATALALLVTVRAAGPWGPGGAALGLVRPLLPASVTTAGLLALANADLLLARHVLPAAASGAYAVGALFAKAALWGPQFVSTLVFPRMARVGRERAVRWSVLACTAAAGCAVAGCAALGGLLVRLVAGDRYADLAGTLWVFAALGGALALVQVLLWARLAVADRRLGALSWACVAGFVVAVLQDPVPTVAGVAARALAASAVLVVVGLAAERAAFRPRRSAPAGTAALPR